MATEVRASWLGADMPATAPIIVTARKPAQNRDGYTVPERVTIELGGTAHAPEVFLILLPEQAERLARSIASVLRGDISRTIDGMLDCGATTTMGAHDAAQA